MMIFLFYLVIGLIFIIIGPLAKHLSIEDKYALKQNKNRNWLYKYSFILTLRLLMMLIYPLFFINFYIIKKKPIEPISFEDKLNESLINRFREIAKYNNTAPTEKSSDEKVIEIYTLICTAFRNASSQREERIPANNLNTIAMKFFKVYEELGEDFMREHLKHELSKYVKEGLRPEYKRELSLL